MQTYTVSVTMRDKRFFRTSVLARNWDHAKQRVQAMGDVANCYLVRYSADGSKHIGLPWVLNEEGVWKRVEC